MHTWNFRWLVLLSTIRLTNRGRVFLAVRGFFDNRESVEGDRDNLVDQGDDPLHSFFSHPLHSSPAWRHGIWAAGLGKLGGWADGTSRLWH